MSSVSISKEGIGDHGGGGVIDSAQKGHYRIRTGVAKTIGRLSWASLADGGSMAGARRTNNRASAAPKRRRRYVCRISRASRAEGARGGIAATN